jgi:CheY-like chemotaxis protein
MRAPRPRCSRPHSDLHAVMKKILVVDDVHALADSMATLFELLGHETRAVYDGQQAVQAANEARPDVVFLDLNMPVLDGYATARVIRDRYPSPSPLIVAVSATVNQAAEARLLEAGFDRYLTKPADVDELIAIVEQADVRTSVLDDAAKGK